MGCSSVRQWSSGLARFQPAFWAKLLGIHALASYGDVLRLALGRGVSAALRPGGQGVPAGHHSKRRGSAEIGCRSSSCRDGETKRTAVR